LFKKIPIHIKNTFAPEDAGTLVCSETEDKPGAVRGISHIENISLLSLEGSGMVGIPGISKRFFEVLSQAEVSVVFITQASSEHSICIGVSSQDAAKAKEALDTAFEYEISLKKIHPVSVENDLAIIALVGDHMKSHQGLSGRMFSALGKNNVNIRAIAQGASERNISAVIDKEDVKKALNTLHEQFFEDHINQRSLVVMSLAALVANSSVIDHPQFKGLQMQINLIVRMVGFANSIKVIFDSAGLEPTASPSPIGSGDTTGLVSFSDGAKSLI